MIKYSVVGAAAYACGEFLRLMVNYPDAELQMVADAFAKGDLIQNVHPQLQGFHDMEILDTYDESLRKLIEASDVVLAAVDAGTTCELADKVLKGGKKFIDFGADLRFRDPAVYEKWYKIKHTYPEMTRNCVYCIPEMNRKDAKGQNLISNPGCYPTASTLGLMPILKEGFVVENTIIIDAKSGYTGAGRRPMLNKMITESENSFRAYSLGGGHRHTPEIEQNIEYITGKHQMINFQPHLSPQIRGIEATIYATSNHDISNEDLYELYQKHYKDEPFVHVYPASKPVETKWTAGTNFCCISPSYDARTKRFIISSVIDNIGKGAAGQAIQNMNIIFGKPETTGLLRPPMYP